MEIEAKLGEIWAIGNRFYLGIGDHENDDHRKLMAFMRREYGASWRPDILYSDLPWTDQIAVQFRRYAGVGMPKRFDTIGTRGSVRGFLAPLLQLMARAATEVDRDVYVEMGEANEQMTISIFEEAGLRFIGRWPITYHKKNPCVLLHFCKPQAKPAQGGDATGMDDLRDTIVWAASRSLGESAGRASWVYDLCTGKGTTPKVVLGMNPNYHFVGLELRPGAALETMQKVSKVLKDQPRKVGTL